jgi:hypothetical protein
MDLYPLGGDIADDEIDFAPAIGGASGFLENFEAARNEALVIQNPVTPRQAWIERYAPLVERLNGGRSNYRAPGFRGPEPFRNPYDPAQWPAAPSQEMRASETARIWAEIERRRKASPRAWAGAPRDERALAEEINEIVRQTKSASDEAAARRDWSGFGGMLAGAMAGAVEDPLNAAALLAGAPAASSVLSAALIEGGIGAATTAATRPAVAGRLNEAGIDYGLEDAALETLTGGAIGGVLGGAGAAVAKGLGADIPWTAAGRKELAAKARAARPDDPDIAADAAIVEQAAILEDSNPLGATQRDMDAHLARLEALTRETMRDPPATATPAPASPMAQETGIPALTIGPAAISDPAPPMGIVDLDPMIVGEDAPRFQFKSGGDAKGVTARLRGVTRWDAEKSGVALVWQDMSGAYWIVDGHQRLGLAKAIAQADPAQRPRIAARILREADGVSAEDAMIRAALKNIAEGTGTSVDAAKVFRLDAGRLNDPSLPRTGALIREGRALAQLEPTSWGMVINGVVSPDMAALVAQAIPDDPILQRAAMQVLHKVDPASATEARAVIAQVIEAGASAETQMGLFGDEIVASSLYEERAKILAAAMKALRRDKNLFGTLVRDGSTIEAAGNRLDAATNAELAQLADTALTVLIAAANRKGALSDALTESAKRYKSGEPLGRAAARFVDDVRGAAQRGDLSGDPGRAGRSGADDGAQTSGVQSGDGAALRGGADGRTGDGPGTGDAADETLSLFGAPGGPAQEAQTARSLSELREIEETDAGAQTVLPGAERDQAGALQRQADAGLKPKTQQRGIDGLALFDPGSQDTTGDLFVALNRVDGPQKGEFAATGKRLSEIEADAQRDADFLDHLKICGE